MWKPKDNLQNSSFFSSCGSGHQIGGWVWQQTPLPTGPSHQEYILYEVMENAKEVIYFFIKGIKL